MLKYSRKKVQELIRGMEHITVVKKRFSLWGAILALTFAVLAAAFGLHCYQVSRDNAATHTISLSAVTDDNGVSIDVHPRGQSTDAWDKQDEVLGTTLKGVIYEATVSNGSPYSLSDWTLRFAFSSDGFLNNAWCGTVELHQLIGGAEQSQTLDLRNCDRSTLTLDHHISGSDLMLTLTPGSSLVYHPSAGDSELPIASGGSVSSGFIFYSDTDAADLSGFTLEYRLHEGYFDDAAFYLVAFTVWALCFLLFVVMAFLSARYEKRLQESDRLLRESMEVFTSFVDAKDPYTKGHSGRVAAYSRAIAERLGFSSGRCKQVYYSALLHDIGKCYVPDEILKKPSRLTEEEFAIIKTHTTHGAEMVKNFSSIPDIRDGILYHHERYDGKGYPTGRKGEDIPLIGRIICVADSYDAMNSSRVYREKLPREVIVQELKRNRGTQFDPKLVDIFLDILRETPEKREL